MHESAKNRPEKKEKIAAFGPERSVSAGRNPKSELSPVLQIHPEGRALLVLAAEAEEALLFSPAQVQPVPLPGLGAVFRQGAAQRTARVPMQVSARS